MTDQTNINTLVIGGSGFVGQALVKLLLLNKCSVTLLNRGHKPIAGTQQLIADRTVPSQMKKAAEGIYRQFDVLIDVSSYSRENSEIAWQCFSHHTEHWVHLSTVAVYKNSQNKPPVETDPIGGADIWGDYGHTKSEAEFFLHQQTRGPRITILRPPYIYGPGNDLDRETFIWSRALQSKPVIIPGDAKTLIQFIHVDDLARAIFRTFSRSREVHLEIYNVAASEKVTLAEYVTTVAQAVNLPNPGVPGGTRTTEFKDRQYFPFRNYPCWANIDKIHKELNWQQQYILSDGLKQTWQTLDHKMLKERILDTAVEDKILANIV